MLIRRRSFLILPAAVPLVASAAGFAQHAGHEQRAQAQPGLKKPRKPSTPGAYCYIGWPNDGEVINSRKFKVWFGTRGFGVAPAGIDAPDTGHHHLLIDAPLPPLDEEIPNDKNHRHYGLGQTETVIEDLAPGQHTLQLLMGDVDHVPHEPPVMSKQIRITIR